MKEKWLTPEEIKRRKEIKKKLFYLSIPLIAAAIGAATSILSNMAMQ
ncbi:hypothetical protein [Pseudalkalibacillus caeni]|nr:hypothetical protein [Pseudalkalibacillus caeni]